MSERDMICVCQHDGAVEAEMLRTYVQQALGVERAEDVVTAACLSLGLEFGVAVDGSMDMWWGVGAASADGTDTFAQCDEPFDGVLDAWVVYSLRRQSWTRGALAETVWLQSLAESWRLLAAIEAAEVAWLEHAGRQAPGKSEYEVRGSCGECKVFDGWHLCAEGKRLREEKLEARHRLSQRWDDGSCGKAEIDRMCGPQDESE